MVQISRCIINWLVVRSGWIRESNLYPSVRTNLTLQYNCLKYSVLISDNTILYQRLEQRNYTRQKIEENVQCEIMKVIAEEARVSYKEDVVVYLKD